MKEANKDTTYCINKECKNKCWRHEINFKFKENENYWFMERCSDPNETIN